MRSIGIDLHKSYAYVFELGQDGAKKHYRVEIDAELSSFFGTLGQDAQVVVEASTSSYRFSEMLGQRAGRVVVSDPAQTRGALSQAAETTTKLPKRWRGCFKATLSEKYGSHLRRAGHCALK